jgi:hypothetical protein
MTQPWPEVRFGVRRHGRQAVAAQTRQGLLKRDCRLMVARAVSTSRGQLHPHDPKGLASWPRRSACQHWCLVNEAFIVDLLDKKVPPLGVRMLNGDPDDHFAAYLSRALRRPRVNRRGKHHLIRALLIELLQLALGLSGSRLASVPPTQKIVPFEF